MDIREEEFADLKLARFYFDAARLAGRFEVAIFERASSADWMACAVTIARIKPGKRCSSSVQRETFCNSTPCRSLRIRPASRRILKCCESVDLGIALSLTLRKFEQFCGQSCATMSAYMATRIRVGQCVEDSFHRDFLYRRMEQGPHTYKSSHLTEMVQ